MSDGNIVVEDQETETSVPVDDNVIVEGPRYENAEVDSTEMNTMVSEVEEAIEDEVYYDKNVDTLDKVYNVVASATETDGLTPAAAEMVSVTLESIYDALGVRKENRNIISTKLFESEKRLMATKASLEGIGDNLRAIMDAFFKAMQWVWDKIVNLWEWFTDSNIKMLDRIVSLRRKVEKNKYARARRDILMLSENAYHTYLGTIGAGKVYSPSDMPDVLNRNVKLQIVKHLGFLLDFKLLFSKFVEKIDVKEEWAQLMSRMFEDMRAAYNTVPSNSGNDFIVITPGRSNNISVHPNPENSSKVIEIKIYPKSFDNVHHSKEKIIEVPTCSGTTLLDIVSTLESSSREIIAQNKKMKEISRNTMSTLRKIMRDSPMASRRISGPDHNKAINVKAAINLLPLLQTLTLEMGKGATQTVRAALQYAEEAYLELEIRKA